MGPTINIYWARRVGRARTRVWSRTCSTLWSSAVSMPSRQRLFVIDGGKALRSGIEEVYGERSAGAALPHPQTARRARALARSAALAGEQRDACGLEAPREGRQSRR